MCQVAPAYSMLQIATLQAQFPDRHVSELSECPAMVDALDQTNDGLLQKVADVHAELPQLIIDASHESIQHIIEHDVGESDRDRVQILVHRFQALLAP